MGIFGWVFGWGKWRVYRLRKKWDRLREWADRLEDQEKKRQVIQLLDRAEPTISQLEEQQLTWTDRGRLTSQVAGQLEEVRALLRQKPEKEALPPPPTGEAPPAAAPPQ